MNRSRAQSPSRYRASPGSSRSPSPAGRKSPIKCYECGGIGHFQRQCPNSRAPEPGCFYCKQEGHRYSECPERGEGKRVVFKENPEAKD
ncbi:Gag polyprotein [Elysia marginata]|uniref:Gag polyprotein n=1 Tax=Elysia marginata TaxID=1093978 RepID=A0AAV4II13_9GAST|nr:Gag polyprotein [Elysia marginata]